MRTGNVLLDALTPDAYASIAPFLTAVTLPAREPVAPAASGAPDAYFPIDCVIAVLTETRNGSAIETATIGNEGMCGTHLVFGTRPGASRWVCQVPGRALRITADRIAALYARDGNARIVIGRYLDATIAALAQTVACNRLHLVAERCARWLLTVSDRVGAVDFPLTHEALATTLGVRRAGISVAAAALQRAGHISYRRGKFHVNDAAGLESAACECYGVVRTLYTQSLQGAT